MKIYFWQGISVVLNFVALFVVVPYLSSQPAIYGTYSICVGMAIFLSYADLGFVSAGTKYAAEACARNDREEEMKIIGFSGFILAFLLFFLSCFFICCSVWPEKIISGLSTVKEQDIASSLFFILGLSVPITLLQRLLQMILSIRLQDYVMQKISIVGSVIRLVSVFYFFATDKYDIVGYYVCSQVVLFFVALITCFVVRRKCNYNFRQLFRHFCFNKKVYDRVKHIAFSSLFMMISWIIYYEFDNLVIGNFLGVEQVSIFAIGLTLLSFFRSILGIIFSPFNARFNHFIGIKDIIGLQKFYLYIVKFAMPFVIFPIVCIVILARPFVLSWVGVEYESSIHIVRWLLMCNLFAFLSYPSGFLLIGLEKIKEIYWINILIPIIYWGGIIIFYSYCGLEAFAIFKCVAFYISVFVYFYISYHFLNIPKWLFLKDLVKSIWIGLSVLIFLTCFCEKYLPTSKSPENLFIILMSICAILFIVFVVQVFVSKDLRAKFLSILYLLKALN